MYRTRSIHTISISLMLFTERSTYGEAPIVIRKNMSKPISKILIITDGASRGNPGPAAIAFGIYDENSRQLKEKAEYIGYATNNEAEYRALIEALDCAAEYCRQEIEHYSDSELLIKQLNGEYRVKARNLKPLVEEVLVQKGMFESVAHWHLSRSNAKVRHVDYLANRELDYSGY